MLNYDDLAGMAGYGVGWGSVAGGWRGSSGESRQRGQRHGDNVHGDGCSSQTTPRVANSVYGKKYVCIT